MQRSPYGSAVSARLRELTGRGGVALGQPAEQGKDPHRGTGPRLEGPRQSAAAESGDGLNTYHCLKG